MTTSGLSAEARLSTAEIIAVGTELLTPFRSDTNSLFLTARLNELGIVVRRKSIVGDDATDLGPAVLEALDRVDLLVVCGGLGPTDDDLTRETVAERAQSAPDRGPINRRATEGSVRCSRVDDAREQSASGVGSRGSACAGQPLWYGAGVVAGSWRSGCRAVARSAA